MMIPSKLLCLEKTASRVEVSTDLKQNYFTKAGKPLFEKIMQ